MNPQFEYLEAINKTIRNAFKAGYEKGYKEGYEKGCEDTEKELEEIQDVLNRERAGSI